jgi:hypothetical protein
MKRDQVISLLKQHEPEFHDAGVGRLFLFGSVARDEATDASDVDVFLDLARTDGFTLFDLVALQSRMQGILGVPVDVMTRQGIHPPPGADRSRRGSGLLMPGAAAIDSLLDIIELVERIERQTANLSEAEFLGNADVEDATAYRLLAIGEATKGLDDDFKARHPEIPWSLIVGLRNILAHEYFIRESAIIWQTV